jgi:limonene-1,2-epoxide hydrolase
MPPGETVAAFIAAIERKDLFEVDGEGRISLWRDEFDMGTVQRRLAELTGS